MGRQKQYTDIEDQLKSYFRAVTHLERLKHKLNTLAKTKARISQDLQEDNITLKSPLHGLAYSNDRVQTSIVGSDQEKAIENAYKKLEQQLCDTDATILATKAEMNDLETSTSDMDFVMGQLEDDERRFLKLKYKDGLSFDKIGMYFNTHSSTAFKRKDAILAKVHSLLYF